MSDIINLLAGLESESDTATGAAAAIATARAARPDAVANAQASFEALLEPAEPGAFTYAERYAVAAFVAGLTQAGGSFYLDLLADESEELVAPSRPPSPPAARKAPISPAPPRPLSHFTTPLRSARALPPRSTTRTCSPSIPRTPHPPRSAISTPRAGTPTPSSRCPSSSPSKPSSCA